MCGRESEGHRSDLFLVYGGGRESWLDLLLVCGRDSEGHKSDLFLVYEGGRESWLDLLLVCGKESEGHRSDLLLVNGRERGLVGPVACVWEGE